MLYRICTYRSAGRPGGVSGYPRVWYIGQFREFEPRQVSAYSYKFVGTFSCAQIDLRKARERELATPDEKATSSGIPEPYLCAIKIEGKNRGGEKGRRL